MAVLPPEIIARVKDETDIVELVGRYVRLQAAGASYKGLCPFHQEKTPSFHVNPSRQSYKCFGCGAGGDAISFLMELESLTFPEAMETLARALDIDLASFLQPGEDEGEKRAYHRALAAASEAFVAAWQDPRRGAEARDYLGGRGFTPEVLDRFDVGWAPGGDWLRQELERRGVSLDLAVGADLIRRGDHGSPFAYFRERIMFPIRNVARQVTGFGGRSLGDGEPKYLNSADSPYFNKSRLLYAFDSARMVMARARTAILVEGYLDVIALAQVQIGNAVATCGTAFTTDQARLIKRGAERVVICFDGDAAGRKAAVKSAHMCLIAGLEAAIAAPAAGRDPADLVMDGGREAVDALLAGAVPYLRFVRDAVARAGDERSALEKGVRQVLTTIAAVPDPVRRELMLKESSDLFGLEVAVLRESLRDLDRPVRQPAAEAADPEPAPAPAPPPRPRFRKFTAVNTDHVATELLAQVLADASGAAARQLLAAADGIAWTRPQARLLIDELRAWAEAGGADTPIRFIEARWHAQDASFRAFVTDLLEHDIPGGGDTERAVREAIERLRLAQRSQLG